MEIAHRPNLYHGVGGGGGGGDGRTIPGVDESVQLNRKENSAVFRSNLIFVFFESKRYGREDEVTPRTTHAVFFFFFYKTDDDVV